MKKIGYLLCALFLMVPVMVNAVTYKSYKIGDEVDLNGAKYRVIVDSDANNSKLTLLRNDIIAISNVDELYNQCGIPSKSGLKATIDTDDYVNFSWFEPACFIEKAALCKATDENCTPVRIDFEGNWDLQEVTYNENSDTNIGYFMKNFVLPALKTETKENLTTARVMTADELVNVYKSDNTTLGNSLNTAYTSYECRLLVQDDLKSFGVNESMPEQYRLSESMDWLFTFNYWWVDSTKYTGKCWEASVHTDDSYVQPTSAGNSYFIRPVIELEKTDVIYTITTKTDGNGKVTASASEARGDENITFTVTPNKGYVLDYIAVTDDNGNTIIFDDYKFTMPNADVTIEAKFVAENPDTVDNIGLYLTLFGISAGMVALLIARKKAEN